MPKNSFNKKKTILGIISLFSFILILVTLSSRFGNGLNFSEYRYNIQKYFKNLADSAGNISSPKTVEVQTLVEEESAIIDVVKKASPSVVSIIVETVNFDFLSGPSVSEEGIGTGFIVDSNGIIVTNSHVVNDTGAGYSVVTNDGINYEVENIHIDRMSDLAILEITARGLPTLELADSDDLEVGQTAIAIGNALGKFQNTVTRGIVSGISREIVASSGRGDQTLYEEVIQTDAALNPGNSGGPLLNIAGQVIGINVATTPYADNISFAIPSNTLKPILETFLKEGRIIRPYIGVSYRLISEELAELRDLPEGAYISSVYRNSPADKADLQRGDIIISVEGTEINSENTLSRVISSHSVGETIEIRIDREGERLTKYITLEEIPQSF